MNTHIIRRQFVDVEFDGSESSALSLQSRLFALCRDELPVALERLFDRVVPAAQHWTIERLEIDAGWLHPDNLDAVVAAIVEQVGRHLREQAPRVEALPLPAASQSRNQRARRPATSRQSLPASFEVRSESEAIQEAFFYFLDSGVLPWWFHLPQPLSLQLAILDHWHHGGGVRRFAQFLPEIMASPHMRKRLVRQFSPEFVAALFSSVHEQTAASVHVIIAELRKRDLLGSMPPEFFEELWQRAFAGALSAESESPETLVAAAIRTVPRQHGSVVEQVAAIWPLPRPHPEQAGTISQEPERLRATIAPSRKFAGAGAPALHLEEGVFTPCAGVVLLHPFLERFFEAIGVAGSGKLLQPERALYLLHFLATGQRFAPEYDLLVPKILCNVPVDQPVSSHFELTTAETEEAEAMLNAVIRHWDALGDTSIDNLRGSFLVRSGKLSQPHGERVLQVEPQSYDILLDRLPWGLGTIQLPWMTQILWVEWRF